MQDRFTGKIYEIYRTDKLPWETAYINEKHNTRYMMVSKLLEMDKNVDSSNRIPMVNTISKYSKKSSRVVKKTTFLGKHMIHQNFAKQMGL